MMKKKKLVLPIIIFLVLGGLIFFGVNWVAPYAIIVPLRADPAAHGKKYKHPYHPRAYDLAYDSLDIPVADSLNLAGYFVKPKADSIKGIVIFLHGVSSCKEVFLEFSKYLSEKGIASALIDLRAHGKSGGRFNTYGFYEKKDISKAASFLRKDYGDLPIGLWGNSLGAAIAYQALAYDSTLAFGVIQSTFSDLPQIIEDYGKRMIGVKIPGLADYALKKASRIADFPAFEVSPSESAKKITQPVYVMHGDKDINISIAYGRQNYENIPHGDKVWHVVEGADHYDLPNLAAGHVDSVVVPWVLAQLEK